MFLIQIYIKSLWSRLVNTEVKIYVYWRPFLVHLLTGLSNKINFKFFITFSTTVHLATATHLPLACRVPVAVSIKCIYKLYQQLELVRCISCASSSTCNLSEIWAQAVGSSLECQLLAALQCGNWPAQKVVSNCHLLMKKIARQSLAWYFHYKGYWSNSSSAYSSYAIRYVVYSADFWHWTDSAGP